MKTRFVVLGLIFAAGAASAASIDHSCMVQACAPGEKAITYTTKTEPYFACPTRELASYTSMVLGIVYAQYNLTGTLPNISDKTGEPEFLDENGKPNQTRLMLDTMRSKAGVSSFDQATSACAVGRNKVRVTILNNQKDDEVIYVHDEARNINYWVPSSSLDKR
jgi:hypothetical protein